jgi:major vault protein
VVGPNTVLLEYDESLEVLSLSTGKPKTTDRLQKTVYLRVSQNHITDILDVRTNDEVDVRLKLSYRVNFEGDESRWFNIENYVKYLCDHIRSVLRHVAKLHGIEEFKKNCIPIIRDVILGKKAEDGSERSGMAFEENGMRVYEVEVLGVTIGDEHIDQMLRRAQHEAVKQTIDLATQQRKLEATKRHETIEQQIAEVEAETAKKRNELAALKLEQELELALSRFEADVKKHEAKLAVSSAEQEVLKDLNEAELAREKAKREQELMLSKQELEQRLTELKAEVEAVVAKAGSVSPQLVGALQAFGDKHIAAAAAQTMAPLGIWKQAGVVDMLKTLLGGTGLAESIGNGGNGKLPGTRATPVEDTPSTTTEKPTTDR